ncbi:Acyl-CoA dehydrogenase [Amycolatopsis marina]|uniref:Acyl-CoA dehydrogenase n=1 Tax=Amycolatopsis marina TaxID=490629 RepID=A0A1I1B948_9PSEU|nr:acyl-CoA dehydrogenase [Amycolatopsis marina]SFB46176.1 Acyl-CoA dehydrogenase [Amycolatopsis marina]
MPIAITPEQLALAESIRDWAADRAPTSAVRARETGDGPDLLPELADIGLFAMGLPEELGGAGASVADVAAGLAEVSAALVPGPVFGGVLAGLLLARAPESPVATELGPALAGGRVRAAVALDRGDLVATVSDQGDLLVSGSPGLVLDAEPGAYLLLPVRSGAVDGVDGVRCVAVAPGTPGVRIDPASPLDFSRSIAHVTLDRVRLRPHDTLPGVDEALVLDLAATLAAADAAGVAAWCVRTAAEYARVREQFGKPIGAFQAVKHLCAEMLCRGEITAALAWDAARAVDETPEQRTPAAAVAAAGCLDAAVDNAKDCVQVLGGIGFTWEHDAHLYLRRALVTRQLLGGTDRWRRRAAELALAGARRSLALDLDGQVDPGFVERARAEVREIAALPEERRRTRLADSGYLMPHWPAPYGLAASPVRQLVIDAELHDARVGRPNLVIGGWAAPTILRHGSDAQRERFLGPTLRGEITWCQLFSEPGAGSDLASLRTKASRADGGWLLTGQKVWTSLARAADWAICLARTDATVPKHRGITYFLVDMRSAGIETRPLREITGESVFNEVFLEDVFVPDDCVVGDVGDGWKLARTTLASERVALGNGPSVGAAVEDLLASLGSAGSPVGDGARTRLGELVAQGTAGSVLELRATLRSLAGRDPGAESSVRKLLGVRHRQDVAEFALESLGPAGAAVGPATAAAQHEFLLTRSLSIAGGTTQVLLNVIGERLLGLPRG